MMQLFRLTIKPAAAFITEPTAGVLLGHLAWAYRYLYGIEALETLLAAYRQADAAPDSMPPLICSAALPQGLLPRPAYRDLLPDARIALARERYGSVGAAALLRLDQALGTLHDTEWMTQATLARLCDSLNAYALFAALLAEQPTSQTRFWSGVRPPTAARGLIERSVRTQPSMNRITGAVQEGQLYDTTSYVYQPGQQLVIWVRLAETFATDEWQARWRACWQVVADQGLGANHSTGYGAFDLVENLLPVPADALPGAAHPNAFLSLSAWIPRSHDPDATVYTLETRHGKLGGLYGSSNNVWKYPVTSLRPGAVGRLVSGAALRPVYGGLIENVHRTRPEIVDFGYAFPLGVRLTKKTEAEE